MLLNLIGGHFWRLRQIVLGLPLVLGIFVLSACQTSQIAESSPTNTSTPVPTAVAQATTTQMPGPTLTSRPTDTALPEPSESPTPEPTITPLPVLSETATSTSTPEIIACEGALTPAQTEGPFYTPNSPERTNLVEAGMGGTLLLVTGKVLNQNCEPMSGVILDFWQTDDNGEYDNVGYRMRGHQFTDQNGNYVLETILPSRYPGRTPHIHVKVFAADGRELLTTQIYIPGISDQIPDGIFRPDLLARNLEPDADERRHIAFDFVVNG